MRFRSYLYSRTIMSASSSTLGLFIFFFLCSFFLFLRLGTIVRKGNVKSEENQAYLQGRDLQLLWVWKKPNTVNTLEWDESKRESS